MCSTFSDALSDSTSASSTVTHVGNCTGDLSSIASGTNSTSRTSDDGNLDDILLVGNLDDILLVPSVKSTSQAKSVNSTARCITNDSFVQEIEDKEERRGNDC